MSNTLFSGYIPNGRQQFYDAVGRALVGGRVFTYKPATLIPVTTYRDQTLSTPNTNPIILDGAGFADIYSASDIRQIVQDQNGNVIWDRICRPVLTASSGAFFSLPDIASLQANTTPLSHVYVEGYYTFNDGGQGLFIWDPADTVSTSDGGSIIVDASGRRYYRDMERRDLISVRWWGAAGTGLGNDAPAIQACFNYAASHGLTPFVPAGNYRTTAALSLAEGAKGIQMQGVIRPTGGFVGLTLGSGGSVRNQNKVYGPVRVVRETQSDWSSEADIGVRIFNLDNGTAIIEQAEKFTINVQLASEGRGVEDSNFYYGRIIDGKIGVDMRTFQPGPNSYVNSIRHYGGHFACSSSTNTTLDRYGFRMSRNAPGDYVLHNGHRFFGPSFELQTGSYLSIPFLMEVDGRGVHAYGIRMEACSPFVARHTSAMNDCLYEVEFVGTFGPYISILYDASATRAGGTIKIRHQSCAASETPRLIAENANIRATAFRDVRDDVNGVGFEGLAVASGNPSGSPTTLNTLIFGGLSSFGLNAEDITVPTSRAVGFVIKTDTVPNTFGLLREYTIAAEGSELRPVVVQFDSSENVLTNTSPLLFSNANATWVGAPSYFWETNVNIDQLSAGLPLFFWQRVTLHANCAFAFIGVRGGSASARLRALRLYAQPLLSPQVIFGNSRRWGSRFSRAEADWTVPSLSSGATTTFDITVPGIRQGDSVQVGFAKTSGFQNGGVIFQSAVGGIASTNQVRVTAHNISGGTIVVGDGRLFVTGTRPYV
jgi:hypothetical protein